MKIVFIAGPYTAPTVEGRAANIAQAELYARALARVGIGFVCPHLNTAHFDEENSYDFFLEMTVALMLRCDAVLALPSWVHSNGARIEVAAARQARIWVFEPGSPEQMDAILAWAKA